MIDSQHVARLEHSLARSLSNEGNVQLLAGFYAENGRVDEAVDLYRRALDEHPEVLAHCEGLGRLLMARMEAGGDEPTALP